MKSVGVIGAGIMGSGVAQNLAQSGYDVVLIDISEDILESAWEKIRTDMRLSAMFSKNKEQIDIEAASSRIVCSTDYQKLKDVDYVIENVTEKWDIKEEVYKKIDLICPEHTVFLVNTSCISITKVGSLTNRKEKVIGTHFMNPVPMKNTIETIRGYHTSEETVEATRELLRGMGKECIIVNDYPGFVSNRISHLFMNEAAFVVQDQVASPEEVDDIFKLCFGHKMGPLETADLIGLDTVADSLDILYESYQDPKFRCCPLLRKMVDAGLLGRKAGQGFYNY